MLLSRILIVNWPLVWSPSECVGLIILFSALVRDFEVELRQKLSLSCLPGCQLLYGHEVFQALIVSQSLHWHGRSFEFRSLFLKASNDC